MATTYWHRIFGNVLCEFLTPVSVTVEIDLPILVNPPQANVVLLRRSGERWRDDKRARLADGIRDTTAPNVILEFKYTESLSMDSFSQAVV